MCALVSDPPDSDLHDTSVWIGQAKAKYPGLDAQDLRTHLRARVSEPEHVANANDLCLAFACARGDSGAVAEFERSCIMGIDRILGHMKLPHATLDEVKQSVRTRLLVGDKPKILSYAGRGGLRAWVGVIATREALEMLRKNRPSEPSDQEALMGIESPHAGPELGYLKEHYRDAFKHAFCNALGELTPRARNALRHHYIHGLSIDRIAALYGVHRSNAARRVAKARDVLLSTTRRHLLIELKVERSELESLMRLVESRLDVSLQRLLEPDSSP